MRARSEPFWQRLPADQRSAAQEAWDERAAIMEYDGGMTRKEAEREAYKQVRAQWQALV